MARRQRTTESREVGRPSKYTPETFKALVYAIGVGLTVEDACRYVDIHKSTYYDWLIEYPELSDAIKTAEVKAKMKRILQIDKAAQEGSWQAAAWYLERKYPEEFGRKLTLQVSPEDAAILKRFGYTLEGAFKMLIQEIAQDLYSGQDDEVIDVSAESSE